MDFLTDAREKLAIANVEVERIWAKGYVKASLHIDTTSVAFSCYPRVGTHLYLSAPTLQEAFDNFMAKLAEHDPRLVGMTLGIVEAA